MCSLATSRAAAAAAAAAAHRTQAACSLARTCIFRALSTGSAERHAVLALGSNLGDRAGNIERGLSLLHENGAFKVEKYSRLFESAAAYVTDQPSFLNSAVLGTTSLGPEPLLHALKDVEARLGRDFGGMRYGPRPVDLDLIFYGGDRVDLDNLQVPHPRCEERDFVMAPIGDLLLGRASGASQRLTSQMEEAVLRWKAGGGEQRTGAADLRQVLPLTSGAGRESRVLPLGNMTYIMGILNATPDSFSDGGKLDSVELAVEAASRMVKEGAHILDIGGQSTRPNADRVSDAEELERVLPVVEALRKVLPDSILSVDTFSSAVARGALIAGADLINDVSGGSLDPNMQSLIAEKRAAYVLMHMRGDPKTMQSQENTSYADVVSEVAGELNHKIRAAITAGVVPWRLVIDPGIGFAKTHGQNSELIRRLAEIRTALAEVPFAPLLVGPSRKGFLGSITGRTTPADRDAATSASVVACVAHGGDMVRVHNIPMNRDAALVADTVWRPSVAINRS